MYINTKFYDYMIYFIGICYLRIIMSRQLKIIFGWKCEPEFKNIQFYEENNLINFNCILQLKYII